MNLIEESFQNQETKKKKRLKKVILTSIIITVLIIIGIIGYIAYLQSTILRLTLDGVSNEGLKKLLVIEEDGTVYLPIKQVASYFGYESYDGDYSAKSEAQNKCYIQSENEIANFTLGSNKIYKLDLSKSTENYEYVYVEKPIKAMNGQLYATSEAIEEAFNISFQYDEKENTITIFTMPYLIQGYQNIVLDYGYSEISNVFANNKTVLKNMLVVSKNSGKTQYGVIGVDGTTILEPKYDNITYIPETGDFLVQSNGKVGIISSNRETKIEIIYDSIELMDKDAGLYIAKRDNRFGVIDIRGNIKINIENDEIGIDVTKFAENEIKNKYILMDNLIPVKNDKYWGLFDKNGNQLVDFEYDSFGYIASNNKNATNLLVIPKYNVLVACKNQKYTLINAAGEKLFEARADDIYMTITGTEKHYYMSVNDKTYDVEGYLDAIGVKPIQNNNQENQEQQNNEEQNNGDNQGQQNGEEQNNGENQEQQNGEEQNNGENQEQQNGEGQNSGENQEQ